MLTAWKQRRSQEKAVHYIGLLDTARCEGSFNDLPELARKVNKHAPHRQCLVQSARAQFDLLQQESKRLSTASSKSSRPSTASYASYMKSLPEIIDKENEYLQDRFQAQVALAEIALKLEDSYLVLKSLPEDLPALLKELSSRPERLFGWTYTCIFKGAYLRARAQELSTGPGDALNVLLSVAPLASQRPSISNTSEQLSYWRESVLTRTCLLSIKLEESDGVSPALVTESFRAWSALMDELQAVKNHQGPLGGRGTERVFQHRRQIWKAYYDHLSRVLKDDLPYNPPPGVTASPGAKERSSYFALEDQHVLRFQQRAELKRVEAIYDHLVVEEVAFPRASEGNYEIEEWAQAVIDNWRIFCGPYWRNEELGDGGKEGVARDVLDILYRAATKSFHSTKILRHLFVVHKSLEEYDLAFKSLDTYLQITLKAKSRQERTGEIEHGLDDTETILRTVVEGMRVLCRYGGQQEAEKAKNMGVTVENWLKGTSGDGASSRPHSPSRHDFVPDFDHGLPPKALAAAYSAIGISQANWAFYTFDESTRKRYQNEAVMNLRKSLSDELEDADNTESSFALALLLAETRQLESSLEIVQRALLPRTDVTLSTGPDGALSETTIGDHFNPGKGEFVIERRLLSLRHLLALLLSATDQSSEAAAYCDKTLESLVVALESGRIEGNGIAIKDHAASNSLAVPITHEPKTLAEISDSLDLFEKERLLQVKMTELVLKAEEQSAISGRPDEELISLYTILFGDPKAFQVKNIAPVNLSIARKSSRGSLRSLAGSLLRRPKSARRANPVHDGVRSSSIPYITSSSSLATTQTALAPSIRITDEDSASVQTEGGEHRSFHHSGLRNPRKLQKRSHSLNRELSSHGEKNNTDELRSASADGGRNLNSNRNENSFPYREKPSEDGSYTSTPNMQSNDASPSESQVGIAVTHDTPRPATSAPDFGGSAKNSSRSLAQFQHNMPEDKEPSPVGQTSQPPEHDIRLPTVHKNSTNTQPNHNFSSLQEQRQKLAALVKVYLLCAKFDLAAERFSEALARTDEASRVVEYLEAEIYRYSAKSRLFDDRAWGNEDTVKGLWANVYAQRGNIFTAQDSFNEAVTEYERALFHAPDDAVAAVGLCNILLDAFSQKIPAVSLTSNGFGSARGLEKSRSTNHLNGKNPYKSSEVSQASSSQGAEQSPRKSLEKSTSRVTEDAPTPEDSLTPSSIERLAARDRAHDLLSTLTKLGHAWDNSEIWFTYARACEEYGEVEQAKEALQKCIELEDTRPIRDWRSIGGGFVL